MHKLKYMLTLLTLLLVGCTGTLTTKAQLAKEIDAVELNTMHRGVYYIGTEDEFHYFAVKWELQAAKYLKVPTRSLQVPNERPRSWSEESWVPLLPEIKNMNLDRWEVLFIENSRKYLMKRSD